jgi:hypothetical protein
MLTWQTNPRNKSHRMSKWHIPFLLADAWNQAFSRQNIFASFSRCGLHPFNPQMALNRVPDLEQAMDTKISRDVTALLAPALASARGLTARRAQSDVKTPEDALRRFKEMCEGEPTTLSTASSK